jgi:hypothetical protein
MIAAPLSGDTVILKSGGFVEGDVTLETSRSVHVMTRFGKRVFNKSEIEEIVKSTPSGGALPAEDFAVLPPALRAVRNARAEYALEQYAAALARIEPHRDYVERPAVRRQIDWLLIEIYERLGRWDEARKLLEEKKADGTQSERLRAETHLAIFDANPDYSLRFLGDVPVRNFILDQQLLDRAKQPDALKDRKVMNAALERSCEKFLLEGDFSVRRFAQSLDLEKTYQACLKLPRAGHVEKHLPYMENLKKAEASLTRAQAILEDYADAYAMDLARTELTHLATVALRMWENAEEVELGDFAPPADPRTGALTPEGREQWRQRCDDYVARLEPLSRLLAYMLERVDYYPDAMRQMRNLLEVYHQRVDNSIKSVKRSRNRTHV